MGVAGSIFGLHPPSSANQCNFLWYTNDITIAFWYTYWFQIYKKTLSSSSPFLKLSLVSVRPNYYNLAWVDHEWKKRGALGNAILGQQLSRAEKKSRQWMKEFLGLET